MPNTGRQGGDTVACLQRTAALLGLPWAGGVMEETLREALPWPWDDPRHQANALVPGRPPLELSFTEAHPRALRFDFEPCPPGTAPERRRERGAELVREWAATRFAPKVVRDFTRCVDVLLDQPLVPRPAFGAFLGAAFDERGLSEVKIYFELQNGIPEALPQGLTRIATAACRTRGLTPHLASVACGREHCDPRLYLLSREEVPLVELRPALAAAGLEHRLAELVSLAATVPGSGLILPPGGAVISFREHASAVDCKLEFLVRALPEGEERLAARLQAFLWQRPETRTALRAWVRVLDENGPVPERVNVVGYRVSANTPAQFGLYVSPAKWGVPCPCLT